MDMLKPNEMSVSELVKWLSDSIIDATKTWLTDSRERNIQETRDKFVELVNSYLVDLSLVHKIPKFKITCDATNNTDATINDGYLIFDLEYVKEDV